jgi:hypothetical protein
MWRPAAGREAKMAISRNARNWLVAVALVGATATLLASGLLWLVLTRPVAVAQLVDGVF